MIKELLIIVYVHAMFLLFVKFLIVMFFKNVLALMFSLNLIVKVADLEIPFFKLVGDVDDT